MNVGRIVAGVAAFGALLVMSNASVPAGATSNSSSAKQCRDWQALYRQDGSTFVDRGACTSYAASGGIMLTSPPPPPPDPTPNLVQARCGIAGWNATQPLAPSSVPPPRQLG
jgi:hypothetical protein